LSAVIWAASMTVPPSVTIPSATTTDITVIAVELADDLTDAHRDCGVLVGVGFHGDRAARLPVSGLRMDRHAE
jgi:hypothetical protein